jgi:hypothetical protein
MLNEKDVYKLVASFISAFVLMIIIGVPILTYFILLFVLYNLSSLTIAVIVGTILTHMFFWSYIYKAISKY